MAINGDESDLLVYTTKWTLLVNIGGLFEINDSTYMLFKEIEDSGIAGDSQRESLISVIADDEPLIYKLYH